MNGIAPLHCLIYSHGWCVHLLENTTLLRDRSLLVELAEQTHLAPVFGQHGRLQPGLAPLLVPPLKRRWFKGPTIATDARAGLEDSLRNAIQVWPGLGLPLVLAADPPLSRAALESAIALLGETPSRFEEIVLLVHVSDVPWLIAPYQYAARFTVVWDIADLPSPALPRMAEALTRQHCLSPERWGGFHVLQHPARAPADLDHRRNAWHDLLAEFPMLGTPAGAV